VTSRPCAPSFSILAASGLGLLALAGCSSLFGIDVPPLLQESAAGAGANDAGAAGAGPLETGGTGVVAQPSGGAAGSANGGAPAAAGGRGGGNGGRSDAGAENDAGAGDTAGESAYGGIAKLNDPCARVGALACPGAVASYWLLCDGGRWQAGGVCGQGEYCDQRNGTCGEGGIPTCEKYGPKTQFCSPDPAGGYDNLTCGLDTVSVAVEVCPFECKDGAGCLPPAGDELALEPASPVATDRSFWPGPTIPVCVTDAEAAAAAWVADEVELTWGRYGGIAFTGWDSCAEDATGVVLTLLPDTEPCRGWLGSVDHVGYPGPNGSVHVSVCTSYFDAAGKETSAVPELVQLAARHEFGHVLGFDDSAAPNSDTDFMARGIHTSELGQYAFGALPIGMLTQAYGRKPAGALLDEHGDCLGLNGGVFSFATCDGSAAQVFSFAQGALVHPNTGDCIAAAPSGVASAASCSAAPATADQDFQPVEVQVRGFGGECLQIDSATDGQGGAGPELTAGDCPDLRTKSAVWTVEYVDAGTRIRMRAVGTSDCVTADPSTLALKVDSCDDCAETDPMCSAADRFAVNAWGQIRLAGQCLAVPDLGSGQARLPSAGKVELAPCSLGPSMLWNLTGRIETSAGTALTYPINTGTPELGAKTIGLGAYDNQIFDFYFSDSPP
jgi:hypothetical protein